MSFVWSQSWTPQPSCLQSASLSVSYPQCTSSIQIGPDPPPSPGLHSPWYPGPWTPRHTVLCKNIIRDHKAGYSYHNVNGIEAVHLTSFGSQTDHQCVTIVNIHHIAFTRATAVMTANFYCYHEHYHVGTRPLYMGKESSKSTASLAKPKTPIAIASGYAVTTDRSPTSIMENFH